MSDPDEIYLQPECCAGDEEGRLWCKNPDPVECEDGVPWTRYILASHPDLVEAIDHYDDGTDDRIDDRAKALAAVVRRLVYGNRA